MRFLLFLDIDGVLHGDATPNLVHVPLFERALIEMPKLEVVISSTWRMDRSLSQLRELVCAELRDRMIGVTPVFEDGLDVGGRRLEIEAFLRDNGLDAANACWRALDDWPHLFGSDCSWLQTVDAQSGLSPKDVESLKDLYWRNQ